MLRTTLRDRARRRACLLVALQASVLLLLAASSEAAAATPGRVPGKLVPASGTLMGAFVNPGNSRTLTPADHQRLVAEFESMVGRKLDVEMWYYRWGKEFWNNVPAWDLANGRIPLVKYGAGGSAPSLDSILDGEQDGAIERLAAGARSIRHLFFFAPFWEMNGSWEAWSGARTSDPGTHNGPSKYVGAWRRMHDIFVREGATNAVWVWAPNKSDVPKVSWNHWSNYYPGDSYVDWVGMDGYNWGTVADWSSWISWETVFRSLYADYAARKPVMVAETASAELGGDKARWMTDARAAIKARYPGLAALVWFHDNKETDWRVDSSPRALDAYRSWMHDPYFNVRAGLVSITFRRAYALVRALRRGMAGHVSATSAADLMATARLGRRAAMRFRLSRRRAVIVARGRASLSGPGNRTLRLRFTSRARHALRDARRLKLKVVVKVARASGELTRIKKTVSLTR